MAPAACGFAQQKGAHVGIGHVGLVQKVEQFAANRIGRFRKRDQAVDRFGEFGGAARAMAHLPGDEARIDRPRAHDAERAPPRACAPAASADRSVEHDKIDRAAEQLCRRGEAADEGGILGAFEKIAARVVARMQQKIGSGDALRERARRRAAFSGGAAVTVRSGCEVRRADGIGVLAAAEAIPRRRSRNCRARCRKICGSSRAAPP